MPSDCYCTDLDFIEVRGRPDGKLRIAAFIEVKSQTSYLSEFQEKVFGLLKKITGVPFYLVNYNQDLTEFEVDGRKMTEKEYVEWMKGL